MTSRYKLALSPLKIGPVIIPNRLVRTAHGTLFSRINFVDAHIDYHLARARGGIGLTILEAGAVHRSSSFACTMTDDSAIAPIRMLVEAIEPTGMKVFQQLWHGGNIELATNGGPSWSVTSLTGRYSRLPPIAMSTRQIAELIRSYGDAAVRQVKAGLHGAEVMAGAGYLLSHFLSPKLNTRADAYGGSFENRVRFLDELLSDIRARVPTSFALGVRVGPSSEPTVLATDEVNEAVLYLEKKGLIDFINIVQGDYYFPIERYAGMDQPPGYQYKVAQEVGKGVSVPRILVGRFGTLDDAEQFLRTGDAEMINLVRATIADPDLVRKESEGRETEVRPCIGCNQGCIGGFLSGRVTCTVNPAVGYEGELGEHLILRASRPRKVVVVGGGPAGMEAARVVALAGHNVTLFEASANLGGQIKLAGLLPKNHGIGDITKWLEREIFRLGVEIHLSSYVDAGEVLALKPDVVILATGSMRLEPSAFVQTAAPHFDVEIEKAASVITSDDLVLGNFRDLGKTAVVFDDIGHYEAIGCCEYLLDRGLDVTYVTRHGSFAPDVEKSGRTQSALRRFYRKGNFRIVTDSILLAIRNGSVEVKPAEGVRSETIPADTTVLIAYRKSLRELWDACFEAGPKVYAVGDAISPRDLLAAIREGHLCARSIDNPELEVRWNNM